MKYLLLLNNLVNLQIMNSIKICKNDICIEATGNYAKKTANVISVVLFAFAVGSLVKALS